MHTRHFLRTVLTCGTTLFALSTSSVWAQAHQHGHTHAPAHAHKHGLVRLDVAVDAGTLTVRLETPMDSLVGFEHRPRNAAQRKAADTALTRLSDPAALLRPDAAAQCKLTESKIDDALLRPQPTTPATPKATSEPEHADIEGTFTFTCQRPEQLKTLTLALFEAFPRMRTIEVQVAGAQGQSRQTLKRPATLVRLAR